MFVKAIENEKTRYLFFNEINKHGAANYMARNKIINFFYKTTRQI